MPPSKTKTSFYRRLYVAWLIHSETASSVPAIMAATGMPRRTAQDTLEHWPSWTSTAPSSKATANATTPAATASATGARSIRAGSKTICRN